MFIKGVKVNGTLVQMDENGIVNITMDGGVTPEPEPTVEKTYLVYYGSSEIKSPDQINDITGTQIAEFSYLDELPGDFSVVDAR